VIAASRPRRLLRSRERSLALAFSLDPAIASTRGGGWRGFHGAGKDCGMLRIYSVILEVVGELAPVARCVERKDKDLARQLRRCSASIALNVAEGMYSRGRNRQARYHSALGSAREAWACLEVAQQCRYISAPEADLLAQLNRVIGTLVKLVA
jgi:four helix bundle protein